MVGHARQLLEAIGPELRQYIVAGNNEERPFTRDQRRWVYASAKQENNYFGFGTDNDLEYTAGYPVIKHRTFGRAVPPSTPTAGHEVDAALREGARRGRAAGPRRSGPTSVVNISGDELRLAVRQRDRGAQPRRGAGRLPAQHRRGRAVAVPPARRRAGLPDRHGVLRLPRRATAGSTCDRLKDLVAGAPVRALEIKLSQGAKPGLGGLLPGAKVSAEIAATRGVPEGEDCVSPSRHAEFCDADSLLDWVELLAAETGLPVGIKSAVGDLGVLGRAHRR